MHHHGFAGLSPALIAVLLIVLLFVTLVLRHLYAA
jgi:hypothetical protein